MLSGYIIASVFMAILFIIVGLTVLSRNSRSNLNKLFMAFSLSLAGWLVSNYVAGDANIPNGIALIANRLVFVFGCASTLTILLFIKSFTKRKINKFEKLLIGLNAIVIAGSFTPLIVSSVKAEEGTYIINFGWLSYVYFLAILVNAVLVAYNLFYAQRHSKGLQRSQIYVIELGFVAGITAIIITNAIFPFAFGYFGLTNAGSLFSAFFVVSIAYAVLKHKLFDLRLIVARSLGYLLSLGLLGVIASFILFVASGYLEKLGLDNNFLRLFYVIIAVVLAIVYQPTKRFFDRITNRLFYRDAYDTKELIDEFNQAIVSTIELEKLLSKSAGVVEKYLRPEFCAFALLDEQAGVRVLHAQKSRVTDKLIDQVRGYTVKNKIVLTDLLETEQSDLKALLGQEDIAIVARITKNTHTEGVGYMILGNKKSGTIYNSQDTDNIEIVTNELAIAIENALQYEEIQRFNVTLQQKVEDATSDLRKANERLKELDQTKDDFISMASHQLRTPLTSVKGYVSMVIEGDAGKISKKQTELLNQAFVSSQRMVYLIADLLNVSRLKTGKFVIEAKETNLADVIEGEIEQLKESAKGRDLEMSYQKPKNFPVLMLDETKIRQVIMNFADNAIYYTPSGGHIKIALEDKGETIEFTVTDDGIGVPKSEQHHLFNKFYRAGNAKKARPDGTGLGLFMAKKVVVAQGGAIIFKSQEGKGSTFGFSFAKKPLLPQNYKGVVATESLVEKPKKISR